MVLLSGLCNLCSPYVSLCWRQPRTVCMLTQQPGERGRQLLRAMG